MLMNLQTGGRTCDLTLVAKGRRSWAKKGGFISDRAGGGASLLKGAVCSLFGTKRRGVWSSKKHSSGSGGKKNPSLAT